MKVLLINGSSRNNGCTGAALQEVERSLQEEGIETERFFIGNAALPDCIACRRCKETGRCVYHLSLIHIYPATSSDEDIYQMTKLVYNSLIGLGRCV